MRAVFGQNWRRKASLVGLLIALGTTLAACDSCGDWWSPLQGNACRHQAPPAR